MGSEQKVAVVTGASRGLGYHFARMLAEEGYTLALGARDVKSLKLLAEDLPTPVLAVKLDVSDPESVNHFRDEVMMSFHRVDVLVNNAGLGIFKRMDEIHFADMQRLFGVNVIGLWQVTQAFLAPLNESQGLVAMISSDVSTRVFENGGPYCATKFAVRAFARTLQIENPDLRVLELRPGAVDTSFAGSVPGAPGKEWFLKPEDVAESLRFALNLPANVRLEEMVVRSKGQPAEY